MVQKAYNSNLHMKQLRESLRKQSVLETYVKHQIKATKNIRALEREKQETIKQKKE